MRMLSSVFKSEPTQVSAFQVRIDADAIGLGKASSRLVHREQSTFGGISRVSNFEQTAPFTAHYHFCAFTGESAMASTLLCIDDRTQMLELRKSTLESHGYCVKTASSGHTALKVLQETPVAAVILEYKSEGMDAEAVACHVKQHFPKLPIILLSAYCDMPERILWLVDDYVLKRELLEGLLRVVEPEVAQSRFAPRCNHPQCSTLTRICHPELRQ